MPLIRRASTGVPKSGAAWMSVLATASTSETPSARSPTTLPEITATMTTANRLYAVSGKPSFVRRSTTGMIWPRRFMTPLTARGVFGTGVIAE